MTLTLDKNSTSQERQAKILELQYERDKLRRIKKQEIIEKTFGKVAFDANMSALDIYKEMRNDWS